MARTGRWRAPEQIEAVRQDLLCVATEIFAERGFGGARVDEIAKRAEGSKTMLYYYYGSKEALFVAVLDRAYAAYDAARDNIDFDAMTPIDALLRFTTFKFDYFASDQNFVRLMMDEAIQGAEIAELVRSGGASDGVGQQLVDRICRRGQAAGEIRTPLDTADLHATIDALCFFNAAGVLKMGSRSVGASSDLRRRSIVNTVERLASASRS